MRMYDYDYIAFACILVPVDAIYQIPNSQIGELEPTNLYGVPIL